MFIVFVVTSSLLLLMARYAEASVSDMTSIAAGLTLKYPKIHFRHEHCRCRFSHEVIS